jgi:hypothetical protein
MVGKSSTQERVKLAVREPAAVLRTLQIRAGTACVQRSILFSGSTAAVGFTTGV